jgi:hypothetical protein
MIRRLFFMVGLLLPRLAYGADPSTDVSVTVTPTPPAAAAAAGFTTLALDSEFSQPQPNGWFACKGGPAGAQWYQGVEGGDTKAAPCSVTNGQPGPASASRFNLITDPTTNKQVLDLSFKLNDLATGLNYATIQTADDSENAANSSVPCCVMGELFPYGFYMEARYRIITTPDADHGVTGGVWSAFWQGGQGLSPFTNPHGTTIEIDHPEQHSELMYNFPGKGIAGPGIEWGVINWYDGSGGGYFSGGSVPQWAQLEDPRQYHTFGVRVTTDGSSGLAHCSYFDGSQIGCNAAAVKNPDQYAEKKYPILFIGISCYWPGQVSVGCLNIPIASWYSCGQPSGSLICIHPAQPLVRQSDGLAVSTSGVAGCDLCNGSWFMYPFNNGNGGTDYYIRQSANDPTAAQPPWPGGTPNGGTINALNQVDMYIDHVRVWTCSAWQSGPCKTSLDTGSP